MVTSRLWRILHPSFPRRISYSYPLALDSSLNRLASFPSPSDIVHTPQHQAQLLGGEKPSIHLGRSGGPPAVIFNPALAISQRRLDHLGQVNVSPSTVECASKYLRYAVTFYEDEVHRQKAIKELVDVAIGEKAKWTSTLGWGDSIKPDGSWWYKDFLVLVLELKNTLGLSGDALLKAVMDYSKIVMREKVRCPTSAALNPVAYLCLQFKRFREFCNFPNVLVGATANCLEIYVAVCVGSIYVSELLTLDLS